MSFDWSQLVSPSVIGACSEDIQRFEEKLGFDLPDDYRHFLKEFNGGRVFVEHEICEANSALSLGVEYFLPLTAPRPSMGVIETRDVQVSHRLCLRQALEIADDLGTGCYYLVLAGERRGAVYFIWKDERPMLSPPEWEAWEVRIPSEMLEISPSFDALGQTLLDHRCRPQR